MMRRRMWGRYYLPLTLLFSLGCGFINYNVNGTIRPVLLALDTNNRRILIWNSIPTINNQPADLVIGQPDFVTTLTSSSQQVLGYPLGLYVDANRMYVSDYSNNRILIWNVIPTSSFVPANVVLGQNDFSSVTANTGLANPTAQTLAAPVGLAAKNGKLYVADENNKRVLVWNTLPNSNFQAADVVVGQTSMSGSAPNGAGVPAGLRNPIGLYSDGIKLFIADRTNNRVLIWNQIPSTNGTQADIVLGQTDFNTVTPNTGGRSAGTMNLPSSVFYDGTHLYVTEINNNRILIWNSLPTANGQPADVVLGQVSFTVGASNQGLSAPTSQTLASSYGVWTNYGQPGVSRPAGY